MSENWRPVVGFEGRYEVSDLGRVRRLARGRGSVPGRILRERDNKQGDGAYAYVDLWAENRPTRKLVHHVVLEAFVGPRPVGMVGCHGPGGHRDNRAANLRWDTQAANIRDIVEAGNHRSRRVTHCPADHELVLPNLVASLAKIGRRACLACLACSRARAALQRHPDWDFQATADDKHAAIIAATKATPTTVTT